MWKRWYVFLGLALAAVNTVAVLDLHAETPSAEDKIKNAETEKFLALKAYDIEYRSAKPAALLVGDSISLKISGIVASQVTEPPGSDKLLSLGVKAVVTKVESSNETSLTLTALKAGTIPLPSLGLSDDKGALFGRTNPFTLEVVSALSQNGSGGAGQPAPDFLPALSTRFPWGMVVAIGILAGILILALIFFILKFIRGKKQELKPIFKSIEKPRPEHEIALNALSQLEQKAYVQKLQFKPHYFGISEILKTYFAKRYSVEAQESTTHELFLLLESTAMNDSIQKEVRTLFQEMDLVKFTEISPQIEKADQLIERAKKIVIQTKKIEVPKTEQKNETEVKV